jgi:hypothetical protein
MIAFVTLLLGLISGIYPIEVNVRGPVAAVDFTLDGAAVGRIDHPPWIARVDLGMDLRPHALVARALDSQGNEISRATQWLNLPRPPAEVDVVLENDGNGVPKAAQLSWQSVNGINPSSIFLTLDGLPLKVDETGRAALPPQDMRALHVLSADLWFPPGVTARRDVAFGGQYGSEVATELTALPVRIRPGASLPPPAALAGWFTLGSQPLPVAAVEEGTGKVVLVRVPAAEEVLDRLTGKIQRSTLPLLQHQMRLGAGDRVRFLSLESSHHQGQKISSELFEIGDELTEKDGGMFWYLTNLRLLKEPRGEKRRISDAVAVAGLQAAAENDPRAVVLVLGREHPDASRYDAATVRRYLAAIHVPLFVWSLYGPNAPAARAWGEGVEDISDLPKLKQATARLKEDLAEQRIVWLDGRHLPQEIALGPEAKGVEIVTKAPER